MLQKLKTRDRKAPRFRWSAGRHNVLNRELFQSYQKDIEDPIQDYKLFKAVIEGFNNEIKAEVIKNRDGVKLPAMMGILAVCSYKTSKDSLRPPVDWSNSMENGVKLKQFNLHTAGLTCKIIYSAYTAKYKFRNWSIWRFKGNRDFTNSVSKAFSENYKYYKQLLRTSHVSKMFKDKYITQRYTINDNIGTNIEHKGNEQAG